MKKPWTLADGMNLLFKMRKALKPVGVEVGLAGSVLFEGRSTKDLDVLLFPTTMFPNVTATTTLHPKKFSFESAMSDIEEALESIGMVQVCDRHFVQEQWRKVGSFDTKWVEVWHTEDRQRVDLFFLEGA